MEGLRPLTVAPTCHILPGRITDWFFSGLGGAAWYIALTIVTFTVQKVPKSTNSSNKDRVVADVEL